jgi:hypothetical protein
MSIFVRMRSLLIPGCIGFILLVVVLSYNLLFLPTQRRYLDDRNFRVLKTLTDQIGVSINTFDRMMDNAENSGVTAETLKAYLTNVAPQLETIDENESEPVVGQDYGDPPKMAVASDDGTHYLYLAFKRTGTKRYVIRTDLEKLIDKLSPPATRCPFDAMVIAQSDGKIIYQRSASGIIIARIDTLENALENTKAGKPEAPIMLDALSRSTTLEHIKIAGTAYLLYSQPLQLPFALADAHRRAAREASGDSGAKPWIVCGLVRADRFRSESQTISDTYVLWISAFILLALAAYPFLKLHVSGITERFRSGDVVTLAVSTCISTAIVTFMLLDFGYCHTWRDQLTRDQMRRLAAALDLNFENEMSKAFDQLQSLYDEDLRATLHKAQLDSEQKGQSQPPKLSGSGATCTPVWACRTEIRSDSKSPTFLDNYPYLLFVTWSDIRGQQRVKWTTRKSVTPFLNLDDGSIPYYRDIKKAFRNLGNPHPLPTRGIGSQYSPNTGDNITVFWRLFDADGNPVSETAPAGNPHNWFCASLVTKPISVFDAILPGGFQFAVIKSDGTVIFHSDHTRNLRENFFSETDRDQEIRSRVAMRTEGSLVATYMGRRSRIYIHPMKANPNDQWTVVIFRDLRPEQMTNLEIISLASILFGLYVGLITVIVLLIRCVQKRHASRNWLWPDSCRAGTYHVLAGANVVAGTALIFLAQLESVLSVLFCATAVPMCALAFNFLLLSRNRNRIEATNRLDGMSSQGWEWAYICACATLVAVVAALPCFPLFRITCDFEQKVFAQACQLRLAADLDERAGNTRMRYQGIELQRYGGKLLAAPEEETTPYFSYHKAFDTRIHSGQDYDPPYQSTTCGLGAAERQQRCVEVFLSALSPSYNQYALESRFLAENGSSDRWTWFSAQSYNKRELVLTKKESCRQVLTIASPLMLYIAPCTGWSCWIVAAGFLLTLFALVRSTARKIFLFDLVETGTGRSPQIECDIHAQQRLFVRRSKFQKLVLVHLAQERLVNPSGNRILADLINDGVIFRDRGLLSIKDPCFADFLQNAVPPDIITDWEKEGTDIRVAWLRTSLLIAGIGVGGFLISSQTDILNTWVTYVTGLAAVVPACLRLLETVRRGTVS